MVLVGSSLACRSKPSFELWRRKPRATVGDKWPRGRFSRARCERRLRVWMRKRLLPSTSALRSPAVYLAAVRRPGELSRQRTTFHRKPTFSHFTNSLVPASIRTYPNPSRLFLLYLFHYKIVDPCRSLPIRIWRNVRQSSCHSGSARSVQSRHQDIWQAC